MKEMTPETLLAVFEEMFGFWPFWGMVAVGGIVALVFLFELVRDRGLRGTRFLRAELFAPVGAVAAIWFVMWATSSGLGDMGGPIDVIVLIAIGAVGAVGLTLLAYVVQGLLPRPRTD